MTQTAAKKTDHQIHAAVLAELKWDPRVDETEIGVEVNDGVVTLTGTVDSFGKKIAAQEAVHCVSGVLDVANDIQVELPGSPVRTDTEIAQAVRQALEWDVWVPQEKIHTTVIDGWVTLQGNVHAWVERNRAEHVIRNLRGVRGLTNNILVAASPVEAQVVERSIEQALERRADREAERIHITLKDGTVSLSGRVHNWNEKQAVLGAAGNTRGVRRVEDHLCIDPYF
ncbi:MAG TPA: BON domain-containing protein [Chthonomonadaceae bacterium]|nr:BON domain-containing protein [Chthonomonadaceae bacterium]